VADGSLPFGEQEPVDPLLAQYNFLRGINIPPHQQPHGPEHIPGHDPSLLTPSLHSLAGWAHQLN
jgi:hypothetical protein